MQERTIARQARIFPKATRTAGEGVLLFINMKKKILIFLILLSSSKATMAGVNTWTSQGPYGGGVWAVVVDRSPTGVIIAKRRSQIQGD